MTFHNNKSEFGKQPTRPKRSSRVSGPFETFHLKDAQQQSLNVQHLNKDNDILSQAHQAPGPRTITAAG